MIGFIRGTLIEKRPPMVCVESFGIGYELEVPLSTLFQLPSLQENVFLYTHFVVREDAQLLYGFYQPTDRNLFRLLLKANGVGPKMALALLSALSVDVLVHALSSGETKLLVQVPGVGKKTAERLVLELRDKVRGELFASVGSQAMPKNQTVLYGNLNATLKTVGEQEAESALVSLGFKSSDAEKVVRKVFSEELSSEELIRLALKEMIV
jgi:holliday junction DNA helicase RuvA